MLALLLLYSYDTPVAAVYSVQQQVNSVSHLRTWYAESCRRRKPCTCEYFLYCVTTRKTKIKQLCTLSVGAVGAERVTSGKPAKDSL